MSSDENSNKRTRASGEVLDFLLQEFEKNHNPTPDQRKDISDKTGMAEKAVRIWFQNRRAKLRKVERMSSTGSVPLAKKTSNTINGNGNGNIASHHSSRSNSLSLNDNISPVNTFANTPSSSSKNEKNIPIEVNEKYCFIDCSSLSVGSWQRIKSGVHDEFALRSNFVNLSPFTLNSVMTNVDLLVILSKKNSEINYFFSAVLNNSKILFRIFYPLSSIVTCSLLDNNINKESNELRISLSHHPKFSVYFFNGVNANSNQWSICDDFSEGQQVSQAYFNEGGSSIPHVLVGVKNSLQFLSTFIIDNSQSHLHQQQLHLANPHYPNPTPPHSATSATHEPHKYHHPIQLADEEEHNSAGNFQFTTDDLNNIWDDATSLTNSQRSRNHTPVAHSFPASTTGSISAHPPSGKHIPSSGLSGFSPLTNFDSAASPNSSASGNSNNIYTNIEKDNFHPHVENSIHNGQFHSHTNSITHTPRSSTNGFQANNNSHASHHQHHHPHDPHSHDSHIDAYDKMFNTANTPDFLTSLGEDHEVSAQVKSNGTSGSIHSDLNSPSINGVTSATTNANNNNNNNNTVHAYTHQTNPNQNGHHLGNQNGYEVSSDTFGLHHGLDFDFGGNSTDFAANNSSSQNTPLSSIDTAGAGSNGPGANGTAGTANSTANNSGSASNSNNTGAGNTNVDSFIDFGI